MGTQTHDGIGVADLLTEDHYTTDGMKDALNSELVDGPGSQDSGLRPRELSSALPTPSTGPSIVGTEQPTQEANGDTLLEAHSTMHQPQRSVDMKAETEGKRAVLQVFCSLSNTGKTSPLTSKARVATAVRDPRTTSTTPAIKEQGRRASENALRLASRTLKRRAQHRSGTL